jgi:CelD/BcsL family acetyltransferase involved in cellulose biosynthesis
MAQQTGRDMNMRRPRKRPTLKIANASVDPVLTLELRRLRHEKAYNVDIAFERARDPRAIRDTVEEFLVLEASTQIRRQGEALIDQVGTASFVRTMTRRLAKTGRCRVDVMRLDGIAVAAAIIIKERDRLWVWRMAFDKKLEDFAPHLQLALEMSRYNQERERFIPMEIGDPDFIQVIAPLWTSMSETVNVAVGLRPNLTSVGLRSRLAEKMRRVAIAARKGRLRDDRIIYPVFSQEERQTDIISAPLPH